MVGLGSLPQELIDMIINHYQADILSTLIYSSFEDDVYKGGAAFLHLRRLSRTFNAAAQRAPASLEQCITIAAFIPQLGRAQLLFALRMPQSGEEHQLLTAIRHATLLTRSEGKAEVAGISSYQKAWDPDCERIGRELCIFVTRAIRDFRGREAQEPSTPSDTMQTLAHTIAVGAAAQNGDLEGLQTLLSQRKYCSDINEYRFEKPILTAVRKGHLTAVQFLYNEYPHPSIWHVRDAKFNSALHCAVTSGSLPVVKFRFEKMDDRAYWSLENSEEMTPAILAGQLGYSLIVEEFLHKAQLELNERPTPFFRRILHDLLVGAVAGDQIHVLERIAQFLEENKQCVGITSRIICQLVFRRNLEAIKILTKPVFINDQDDPTLME
ncbi:hypothetical protein BDV19DRAFT_394674 [Aspergillus venezuelensis]